MTQAAHLWALRARLVFPVSAPPLRDGVVTIADDRIVAVGREPVGRRLPPTWATWPSCPDSSIRTRISNSAGSRVRWDTAGCLCPTWITEVVSYRRAAESESARDNLVRASRRHWPPACRKCLASGVTTVGDMVTFDLDDLSWYQLPVRWYAFRELLGQTPAAIARQVADAHRHLQQLAAATGSGRP